MTVGDSRGYLTHQILNTFYNYATKQDESPDSKSVRRFGDSTSSAALHQPVLLASKMVYCNRINLILIPSL